MMNSKTYWAIRQISTGHYLPSHTGTRKNHTWAEPTEKAVPRLFSKKGDAKQALDWWLQGKCMMKYYPDTWIGPGEWNIGNKYDPSRKESDMEIVEVTLMCGKEQA